MDALTLQPNTQDMAARRAMQAAERTQQVRDAAASNPEMAKIAEDFEAVFIAQMMQPMFDSVEKDPLLHGGHGEDMFQSLLTEEYGKGFAGSGGIGLAEHVLDQMLRLQEANQ